MTRPFELYVLMEALVQLKCFLDVSDYGLIRLIRLYKTVLSDSRQFRPISDSFD